MLLVSDFYVNHQILELINCLFNENCAVLENYHSPITQNYIIVKRYHLVMEHLELEPMNKGSV